MQDRKLPKELQNRIIDYYSHYYAQKSIFNEKDILKGLSMSLRNAIIHDTNRTLINDLEVFKHLDPSVMTNLVTKMRPMYQVRILW